MRQLLPGLYHWQAFHPHNKHDVDAYYATLEPPVLIDPMACSPASERWPGQVSNACAPISTGCT